MRRRRHESLWVPYRCCLFQVSMPFEMASHCCSQRTLISCRYCVMSISLADLPQVLWISRMAPLLVQLSPASGWEMLVSSVRGRECHMQQHLPVTAASFNPSNLETRASGLSNRKGLRLDSCGFFLAHTLITVSSSWNICYRALVSVRR